MSTILITQNTNQVLIMSLNHDSFLRNGACWHYQHTIIDESSYSQTRGWVIQPPDYRDAIEEFQPERHSSLINKCVSSSAECRYTDFSRHYCICVANTRFLSSTVEYIAEEYRFLELTNRINILKRIAEEKMSLR